MTSAIAPNSSVVLRPERLRSRRAERATEMKTTMKSALVRYRTSSAAVISTLTHSVHRRHATSHRRRTVRPVAGLCQLTIIDEVVTMFFGAYGRDYKFGRNTDALSSRSPTNV